MNYKILLLSIFTFSFFFSCSKDNTTNPTPANYESVAIGTQVWMKKNLDVDHYRNGDLIPEVRDSIEWINIGKGAWCYYNNDSAIGTVYGKIYNWYAVNDPRGLAPIGWHIPSNSEWTILVNYLGGDSIAGSKMKESGNTHWVSPNTKATNSCGVTGLPGGCRYFNGLFVGIGEYDGMWSSTIAYSGSVEFIQVWALKYNLAQCLKGWGAKEDGFSVRCIKD